MSGWLPDGRGLDPLTGWQVVVSPLLPLHPSPGEEGRRIARHGLADVLEWLGEDVGPTPEALLEAVAGVDPAGLGRVLFVSAEMFARLKAELA